MLRNTWHGQLLGLVCLTTEQRPSFQYTALYVLFLEKLIFSAESLLEVFLHCAGACYARLDFAHPYFSENGPYRQKDNQERDFKRQAH